MKFSFLVKLNSVLAVIWIASGASTYSQKLDLSSIEGLASKAKEVTRVSIDQDKLGQALGFLTGEEKDSPALKDLKGVYVRVFEFDKDGQYTDQDLAPIRAQLQAPGWQQVIEVQSSGDREQVNIYFYSEGEKVAGFALIVAEPEELVVVNILGAVNLKDLSVLGSLGKLAKKSTLKSGSPPKEKQ